MNAQALDPSPGEHLAAVSLWNTLDVHRQPHFAGVLRATVSAARRLDAACYLLALTTWDRALTVLAVDPVDLGNLTGPAQSRRMSCRRSTAVNGSDPRHGPLPGTICPN